jgi:hypothetical protein
MKEYINKIIQTSTAIIIACILVYGVVYVQQVRCGTIVDTCISTSKEISVSYNIGNSCRLSASHILNNKLQLNLCSKNFLTDFGSGNSCCETGRCDGYNQVTEFSLSLIQGFFPLQKNVNSFDAGNGAQDRFKPYNLSTPRKAVPIYILIESIIC